MMTTEMSEMLVSVYSTPVAFDAELVRAILADEDIPSTVENSTAPFPGIQAVPCEVMVAKEYESRARELVEELQFEHRRRVEREFEDEEPVMFLDET